MIFQSLKEHFPARAPEWAMSGFLITWGSYVLLHPGIFTNPATRAATAGMARLVEDTGFQPAGVWGLSALALGVTRALALFVNGEYSRTPVIRLITCAASAFLISQVICGLLQTGIESFGIPTYSTLFLLELVSAARATSDIPVAKYNDLQSRGTRGARIARGH